MISLKPFIKIFRPGICINLEVVILGILHQLFLKIKENQQKLMTISFFINLT